MPLPAEVLLCLLDPLALAGRDGVPALHLEDELLEGNLLALDRDPVRDGRTNLAPSRLMRSSNCFRSNSFMPPDWGARFKGVPGGAGPK